MRTILIFKIQPSSWSAQYFFFFHPVESSREKQTGAGSRDGRLLDARQESSATSLKRSLHPPAGNIHDVAKAAPSSSWCLRML